MPKEKTDLLQGTLDLLILKALQLGSMHGFGVSVLNGDAWRVCVIFNAGPGTIRWDLGHHQWADLSPSNSFSGAFELYHRRSVFPPQWGQSTEVSASSSGNSR